MTGDGREIADGRYTAVLDRFEETDPANTSMGSGRELAVLLLESGEEVVAERAVPAWRLPEAARDADAVLELSIQNGHVVSMSYQSEETERRSTEAQSRFDRLAERPGESGESGKSEESNGGSDGAS